MTSQRVRWTRLSAVMALAYGLAVTTIVETVAIQWRPRRGCYFSVRPHAAAALSRLYCIEPGGRTGK
jgi:hypothetical protein